jgi:tRNA (guanine37-N1)-methyltransferase
VRIDIVTLFPRICEEYVGESILKRAGEQGLAEIRVVNLRDYTRDRHRTADDRPYGGGAGMVLKAEPLFAAVEDLKTPSARVILLSPRGRIFDQKAALRLSRGKHLILIAGRYEGVDERVGEYLVDEEISIGDYILTGGELPALAVADSVVRLLPGVLGDPESAIDESFAQGRLEYPQYTRPEEYRGMAVPEILLSGDHQAVARWRARQALLLTLKRRPDLLGKHPPDDEEKKWLEEIQKVTGGGGPAGF